MPAISNSLDRFKLLNLGYLRGGRGPYAIRQDGYAPGSMTLDENRFILMDDGSWMLNYRFFLLPEEEQEKQLFGSLPEVFEALDALAGKEVVVHDQLPNGATKEMVLARMRAVRNRLTIRLHEARADALKR